MIKMSEPVKTIFRHCHNCGHETPQEKQIDGWWLCFECLFNADSKFRSEGKKKGEIT